MKRNLVALLLSLPFLFILWCITWISEDKNFSFKVSRKFFLTKNK